MTQIEHIVLWETVVFEYFFLFFIHCTIVILVPLRYYYIYIHIQMFSYTYTVFNKNKFVFFLSIGIWLDSEKALKTSAEKESKFFLIRIMCTSESFTIRSWACFKVLHSSGNSGQFHFHLRIEKNANHLNWSNFEHVPLKATRRRCTTIFTRGSTLCNITVVEPTVND